MKILTMICLKQFVLVTWNWFSKNIKNQCFSIRDFQLQIYLKHHVNRSCECKKYTVFFWKRFDHSL